MTQAPKSIEMRKFSLFSNFRMQCFEVAGKLTGFFFGGETKIDLWEGFWVPPPQKFAIGWWKNQCVLKKLTLLQCPISRFLTWPFAEK